MAAPTPAPKEASVRVSLYNDADLAKEDSEIVVTLALAGLLSYAHFWTHKGTRDDDYTLSFSSMLAALVAGEDRLCTWLRQHLALRGSSEDTVTRGRRVERRPLPDQRFNTTISFRSALEEAESLAAGQTLDVRHFMAGYVVVPGGDSWGILFACISTVGRGASSSPAFWSAHIRWKPLCLANIASGQKSFDVRAVTGHSTRDASRRRNGRDNPIHLGHTSRPAARDSCAAPPVERPRSAESPLSRH